MTNSFASPLTLKMTGTYEIALARNQLRNYAAQHEILPLLRARSAAAITIIASVILFKSSDSNPTLELEVRPLEDDEVEGIEFQFYANLTHDISKRFVIAEMQLERVCDEIGITNRGDHDLVVMKIWAKRRRR